jgi:nitroimidazol reductase NimA-like FMN-containing flavoprotein (pyridoxamine 5'-phosphate oxidase superfamily)
MILVTTTTDRSTIDISGAVDTVSMRQAEREIKDREVIDDLIKRALVCRLGLIDGEEPYIVPMNFGYDGKSLYFHCAKEGRKLDIIRLHNKVCFEIDLDTEVIKGDVACKWSMRYRSVVGVGTAHLVDDMEGKMHGLNVIMSHYTKGPFEYAERGFDLALVIRVDIESVSGKRSKY